MFRPRPKMMEMSASVATSTAPREPKKGHTRPATNSTPMAMRCWRAPSAGSDGSPTAPPPPPPPAPAARAAEHRPAQLEQEHRDHGHPDRAPVRLQHDLVALDPQLQAERG